METTTKLTEHNILNQTHTITSPFNKDEFFLAVKSAIESKVFNELINKSKTALKVTFTVDVIE